jgi:hypothetical protein
MKARLAIIVAVASISLGLAAHAFAVGAPSQVAPADAAVFTAGDQITFSGTVTAPLPAQMDFYISRDTLVQGDGRLQNWIDVVRGNPTSGDPSVFAGSPNSDTVWPDKPGTYYWQAVYHDCTQDPDCFNTSATRSFVINPKPAAGPGNGPKTFLKRHPRHRIHKRTVKFTFYSNVKGAHFQCLFAQGWKRCKSPHVFNDLKPGRYQFQVRAVVNAVEDPTPASWFFRVLP